MKIIIKRDQPQYLSIRRVSFAIHFSNKNKNERQTNRYMKTMNIVRETGQRDVISKLCSLNLLDIGDEILCTHYRHCIVEKFCVKNVDENKKNSEEVDRLFIKKKMNKINRI